MTEAIDLEAHLGKDVSNNRLDLGQIMEGFYLIPLVSAFVEVGILEELRNFGTLDLEKFCKEKHYQFSVLEHLCDYMLVKGFLKKTGRTHLLTQTGELLMQDWPLLMIHFSYVPMLDGLIDMVKGTKQYGYGKDVYRNLYYDTKGSGAGGIRLNGRFGRVSDYVLRRNHRAVLDLGCGDGTFLFFLAEKANNQVKIIGLDQSSENVHALNERASVLGLKALSTFVQGDLMKPETITSWDGLRQATMATVWFVLHELTYESNEPAVDFLRRFKEFLPGVSLAVTEHYALPDNLMGKYAFRAVAENYLNHHLSRQRPLQRDQWISIFDRAGFKVIDSIVHFEVEGGPPLIETLVIA